MPISLQLTTAGRAALINAANTGSTAVTISQVGLTQTAFVANAATAALPGEFVRLGTVAGEATPDDVMHVSVRDEGASAYSLRGFALYLSSGVLFAAYGQADPILTKAAASVMLLSIDVALAAGDAGLIEFGDTDFIQAMATTDQPGLVELATAQETAAGLDSQRAIVPAGLKSALDGRLGADAPTAFGKSLIAAGGAGPARQTLGLGNAAMATLGATNGLDADLLDGQHGAFYRSWNNLTGVPATFPPAAHGHGLAAIDGLVDALASKQPFLGYRPLRSDGDDVITGSLTAAFPFPNWGYSSLSPGSEGHPGYVSFWAQPGLRWGYIGYRSGTDLVIASENGANWLFTQRPSFAGYTPWDSANFDAVRPTVKSIRVEDNQPALTVENHVRNLSAAVGSSARVILTNGVAHAYVFLDLVVAADHTRAVLATAPNVQRLVLDAKLHEIRTSDGPNSLIIAPGYSAFYAPVFGVTPEPLSNNLMMPTTQWVRQRLAEMPQVVSGMGSTGWRWDPADGFLEQWGTLSQSLGEQLVTVNFPRAFEQVYGIQAVAIDPSANIGTSTWIFEKSLGLTSAQLMVNRSGGGSPNVAGLRWRVWGHAAVTPAIAAAAPPDPDPFDPGSM